MVKKALRYAQGTKDYMLIYRRSDSLEIKGYSDADFAGDRDDRKSTSGYVFTLVGGAISWKSSKQSTVASSTMYAEFIACFEATGQAIWLKKFIPDFESGRLYSQTTKDVLRQPTRSILRSQQQVE